MREVPPDGFDAAVCMGNSFGYLDPEGTRTFVAALAAAVRPGGGLVVDFSAAAETILPGFTGEDRTMTRGDITVAATTDYDVAHSRLVSGYRFTGGAEEVAVTALHHVLTCAQIDDLLTRRASSTSRYYAGPDGEPFRLGSPRLLLTARRGEGADHVNEAAACGAPGPSARATIRPSGMRTAVSVASLTAVTPPRRPARPPRPARSARPVARRAGTPRPGVGRRRRGRGGPAGRARRARR